MDILAVILILIGLLVLGAIAVFILIYNSFITLRSRINNAWAQIDVQMKKRYDLVPNLVETVKGYMKYERGVLEEVTKARASMAKAGSVQEKAKASNMMTDALKSLFAVVENYPDLKANKNFLMLQEELSGIENKIAYARQFYNDSVMSYNMKREQFPYNMVASMFGFEKRDYFKPPEGEAVDKPVKVNFE